MKGAKLARSQRRGVPCEKCCIRGKIALGLLWALVAMAGRSQGSRIGDVGRRLSPNAEMELRRSTARYQRHLLGDESVDGILPEKSQAEKEEEIKELEALTFADPYHLGVTITDYDEQRTAWLLRHQDALETSAPSRRPRVLLITGSQPKACKASGGDHFHIKALKNKIDYARMHGFEIYYNFLSLDPSFTGVWTKLPIVRNLMLSHPEIEWFIWMDADAVFTDMLFEIPFQDYDDYNMVIWAWMSGFQKKNWVSVNSGIFLIRNCQWSLDLFDKWSPMGPVGKIRDTAGKMLSSYLTSRRDHYAADDQSALMYVMLKDEAVMEKVKLIEREYHLHGYWVGIVQHYEEFEEKYHPGLGDCRWPLVTHFTGCSPCTGHNNPEYPLEMCMANFNRAFRFADNQVLAYMGFQHETLESEEMVRIWNETSHPLQYVGTNPWADKVAQVAVAPTKKC